MSFHKAGILEKKPKYILKASRLLMLGPQDCILQHYLEPEAGPEGGIQNYQQCFLWLVC